NHHQGPAPWVSEGRADWTCTYYHRASVQGLGFERTMAGSGALAQYSAPYQAEVANLDSCPLNFLLWYHHVAWDHRLTTGNTLWEELCVRYQRGVDRARWMQQAWSELSSHVDALRHAEVSARLVRQVSDAIFWKNACLSYFQSWSKRPYPPGVESPPLTLD